MQSASPQFWKVFTVKWVSPGVRAAGKTNARHSVSSQLVKYNIIGATIFITFRTQIHTKKFCKNGFSNLQGTMSHCPLTNTSSLKIAAAYALHCMGSMDGDLPGSWPYDTFSNRIFYKNVLLKWPGANWTSFLLDSVKVIVIR